MAKKTNTRAAKATKAKTEKPKKTEPAKRATKSEKLKKVSALDAAATVLAGASAPMSCPELIAEMAEKGLWTSPGGKTPAATLYSAILREVKVKGKDARFRKTDGGHFEHTGKT